MSNPQDFFTGLKESQEGPFGIANQYIGDIEKRKAYKLELAMKSSIIEQELQAKMQAERVQQEQAAKISQDKFNYERNAKSPEVGRLANVIGTLGASTEAQEQLKALGGTVSPEQEAAILSGVKQKTKSQNSLLDFMEKERIRAENRPKRSFIVSADGRSMRVVADPKTGKELFRDDLGASGASATRGQQAAADFETAHAMLTEASDQIRSVFTAQDVWGRAKQYADFKINELTQENPEQAALLGLLEAMTTPLARGLGDVRVSDQDKENMRNAMPKSGDTVAKALHNLENLDKTFRARRNGAVEAYSTSLSGIRHKIKEEEKGRPKHSKDAIKSLLGDIRGGKKE